MGLVSCEHERICSYSFSTDGHYAISVQSTAGKLRREMTTSSRYTDNYLLLTVIRQRSSVHQRHGRTFDGRTDDLYYVHRAVKTTPSTTSVPVPSPLLTRSAASFYRAMHAARSRSSVRRPSVRP